MTAAHLPTLQRPALVAEAVTRPQLPPGYRASARRARRGIAFPILIILIGFMGLYSFRPAATVDEVGVGAHAAASASGVEAGTPTKRAAVMLLGVFAALTLSAARRRRVALMLQYGTRAVLGRFWVAKGVAPNRSLRLLVVAYVGMACMSVYWASDTSLATKRVLVFFVIAFTAYVLAQTWSLREVVLFTIAANATSLLLGILGAIARRDFTPLAHDYRFVGFSNPNLHGMEAACLIIAAAAAFWLERDRRSRRVFAALILFGIAMLVLTKSRTALAACGIGTALAVLVAVQRQRLMVMGAAAALVIFAGAAVAPTVVSTTAAAINLGRTGAQEDPATLSGRTLLWIDLLDYSADRPWLGYGYDSFWSPSHIAQVSARRGWVVMQSHSGYIQALLNVGRIGVGLLIFLLLMGLRTSIRRYRLRRGALTLFPVAMLGWYIANMITEAVPEEHFSTLVIMILLAHFAFSSAAPDDWESGDAGELPAEATPRVSTQPA